MTFVGYFSPIRELVIDFFTGQADGWAYFWVGFFTLATYGNAGWLREQVCIYMCPYARFQSVMFDKDTLIVSYDPRRALAFGVQLTDYYGGYWASSFYASPQVFVFTPNDVASLAVPGIGGLRQHQPLLREHYREVVSRLHQLQQSQSLLLTDSRVRWMRAPLQLYPRSRSVVAMIGLDAPAAVLPANQPQGLLTLAAVVDTSQVDEFERVLQRSVYNQFTLISPQGDVLLGSLGDEHMAPLGLSFNSQGLRFKMLSEGGEHWTGLYAISYQDFLRYAKWPLLGLGLTFLAAVLLGWWINHWYKTRLLLYV